MAEQPANGFELPANQGLLEAYDELAGIMFDPELSDEERLRQRHEFRHRFIAENSFRQYGKLVIAVLKDQLDMKYIDQELVKLQHGS